MINQQTIDQVKQKLVSFYNPCEIYLFGSYAWGDPDEDSDLDLLIVVDKCETVERYKKMEDGHRVLIGMGIAKDIIVMSQEEFDSAAQDPVRIFFRIKNEGKQIYARA